ncbi:DUF3164 family protein [Nitrospirillum amazonense]|uniref:DUF3164 family protein n=1 Tax=Nitrospirillum amazonense TaxID=28077 RepID=UPI00241265F0|nr:DUF3164 family protein [Nitrospirillum amazonense]MDG3444508.1 DUF3164 family protein [Nitrospirillum amazonense]
MTPTLFLDTLHLEYPVPPEIPATAPTLAKRLHALLSTFDGNEDDFAAAWREACAALEAIPSVPPATVTLADGEYWRTEDGALVPARVVKEADQVKDGFVRNVAAAALQLSASLARFKALTLSEGHSLVELLGANFGIEVGGTKGNVTFHSFDREWQVELAKADRLVFEGAELQAARAALEKWVAASEGAPELKLIIHRAFGLDEEGQVRANELFRLMTFEMPGADWARAMDALRASIHIAGKAEYLRVRRRNAEGRYDLIPLSLASV